MNAAFYITPKRSVTYLYEDWTVKYALSQLKKHGYNAVPVIDRDGCYTGSLSQGDVLWFINELMQHGETDILAQCERTLVKQIVPQGKYPAAHIDIPESELVERALEQNFVPLVDDRKSFIGIVTRRSIMSKKFKPL